MHLLIKLFKVFVALPTILALAHDIQVYRLYPEKGFKLSPAGYFWATYDNATYEQARVNLDPELWTNISYFLAFKGVYLFGFAALFIYLIIALVERLLYGSGSTQTYHNRTSFLDEAFDRKPYRYKRRR